MVAVQLRNSHRLVRSLKTEEQKLAVIKELGRWRFLLIAAISSLALLGLLLAIIISEQCSYGYIPSESEEAEGWVNPYKLPGAGCSDKPAVIYGLQSVVAFTTLVLCIIVPWYRIVSYRELEKQLAYVIAYGGVNIGSISILHKSSRQRRWMQTLTTLSLEMALCVLAHPFPGYTSTVRVQALDRESIYQFESIVVIFMIGRYVLSFRESAGACP